MPPVRLVGTLLEKYIKLVAPSSFFLTLLYIINVNRFTLKEIMLVGYNTNISYKERVYHIQTEDSGQANPVIVTLLYSKGAILASKKIGYAHIVAEPHYEEKVRTMMREQHKDMIKGLLAGKYTQGYRKEGEDVKKEAAGEEKTAKTQPVETAEEHLKDEEETVETKDRIAKSLDDILLNYIMKRVK